MSVCTYSSDVSLVSVFLFRLNVFVVMRGMFVNEFHRLDGVDRPTAVVKSRLPTLVKKRIRHCAVVIVFVSDDEYHVLIELKDCLTENRSIGYCRMIG